MCLQHHRTQPAHFFSANKSFQAVNNLSAWSPTHSQTNTWCRLCVKRPKHTPRARSPLSGCSGGSRSVYVCLLIPSHVSVLWWWLFWLGSSVLFVPVSTTTISLFLHPYFSVSRCPCCRRLHLRRPLWFSLWSPPAARPHPGATRSRRRYDDVPHVSSV